MTKKKKSQQWIVRSVPLKVVRSRMSEGKLSLRGSGGYGDGAKSHVTAAFKDGDDVVLVLKSDYDRLVALASNFVG